VIEIARRVTGRDIAVVRAQRRTGDPAVLVASPERAIAQLGWRIVHDKLDEIIGSAWDWMQAHPEGYATR
jgi:UDP-glucose 4-epimerase